MKFDVVLWWLAAAIIVGAIGAQYYFQTQPLLYRAGGMGVALVLALLMVARTPAVTRAFGYWQDALVELRKVVWPTRPEIMQTTIAVLVMVFVMGLVLWSIDAVLIRVMAWILKQGAV